MRIVKITQESYEAAGLKTGIGLSPDQQGITAEMIRDARLKIYAALDCPVALLGLTKVTYLEKTDRYTATFFGSEKSVTLKTSDEVAEFLTANVKEHGSWSGRIEKGVLVDVCLIQL